MKKGMLKKSVLFIGAVILMISFVGFALSSEEIAETKVINGSIVGISADTGAVHELAKVR